ncbi:CAF17-like 4Fe-4S cluster assembly/insertion protein YgfZ [Solimonas terrae]|uniref:Folate-binding protein YgfZ n=1 Tax=Solimonas terrae TaxID=1396819 RepID=A0A6M2BPM1_9GAMM|nr:folate-binding protein YgfZ [Solimonas terrae]NGY04428.1 folate-binding protein YgfZ [Solimonas terrae]
MNTLFADTPEQRWLRVRGDDAVTFLQGQLSNDLRKLTAETAQLTSYSNAKGRMLAVLLLVRVGDEILVELPRSIADATLARLKMFVLRAKVVVEKADDIAALGIIGEGATAFMTEYGLPVPDTALQCLGDTQRLTVVRRLGATARYSVIGTQERIAALRARLPTASYCDDPELWRRTDIENGIPVVLPETREHFVAQMANLDLLGGISFDKGCYTGQEIVARLHYLGQLKRRMFVARIDGPPPAPGTAILQHGETQAAGEIVDAVGDAAGGSLATLVLQLGARDAALSIEGSSARVGIVSGPPD